MTRGFSLAHLTVLDLAPPAMIRTAARTGYSGVGLRLIAVNETTPGYPLMDDPAMMRETKSALAETGIAVCDIEFVRITPELDVAALEPFVAAGAELGARFLITAAYETDRVRLVDRLSAVGALAASYGLRPLLEFFPWTPMVCDVASAHQVAEAAGPDVGVLVDTLHFDRSRSRLDQLALVPPARLPLLHVADAPVRPRYTTEELLHAARAERLPPGEGQIDIRGIARTMPPGVPIALEVPMASASAKLGSEAVARHVRLAAQSVFCPPGERQ